MNKYYSVLHALLLLAGFSVQALAGPCDAYYRFDGNLSDEGGNGNAGQMIGPDGAVATAQFVEGRSGQALKLDGSAAMRAFVDLNRDRCPQVTVTAWVKVAPAASQTILGTDGGAWLWASGSSLGLRTGGKDLTARDAIYANGGWMFVAAVWDHASGTHRLHWHGRQAEQAIGKSPAQAKPAIWVGANNDRLHHPAKDIVIDELRIIGSALDAERIMAMRDAPAGAGQSQTAMAGTAGQACSSYAGCPAGSYCGMDGTCHPDSHRPMQSGGTTLQDLQASSAERNAGIADAIDYESPTDLLQNAGSGEAGGTGESGRLSPETEQAIADRVAENRPPEIGYASEEEANAAAERREQERLEEEERVRQEAEAAAAAESDPSSGGFTLSDGARRSPVTGYSGATSIPVDLIDEPIEKIRVLRRGQTLADAASKPISVEITGRSGRVLRSKDYHDIAGKLQVGRSGAAIGTIRACSNPSNGRLVGLQVEGNDLDDDGGYGQYFKDTDESKPYCTQWHETERCPDIEAVASGVVVHYQKATLNEDKVTGIQLICRVVVPN